MFFKVVVVPYDSYDEPYLFNRLASESVLEESRVPFFCGSMSSNDQILIIVRWLLIVVLGLFKGVLFMLDALIQNNKVSGGFKQINLF